MSSPSTIAVTIAAEVRTNADELHEGELLGEVRVRAWAGSSGVYDNAAFEICDTAGRVLFSAPLELLASQLLLLEPRLGQFLQHVEG